VETAPGNFARAPERLAQLGLRAGVVLADLGFASTHVADASRGFSFQRDGPLDMRLDPAAPITAAELVNTLPEEDLASLIEEFGEERHARRVARKVVESRAGGPISTTFGLASIVRAAVPAGRDQRIDPATRTFQALRIAVNDEIGSLGALLRAVRAGARRAGESGSWLERGARVAVIAFHSLEDRPVKRGFHGLIAEGLASDLTRKPIVAGEDERGRNPRARSAKLRAVRLNT
jgi:16S rRNA (cytosine1402-N4)-methyltransferase